MHACAHTDAANTHKYSLYTWRQKCLYVLSISAETKPSFTTYLHKQTLSNSLCLSAVTAHFFLQPLTVFTWAQFCFLVLFPSALLSLLTFFAFLVVAQSNIKSKVKTSLAIFLPLKSNFPNVSFPHWFIYWFWKQWSQYWLISLGKADNSTNPTSHVFASVGHLPITFSVITEIIFWLFLIALDCSS